MSDSPSGSGVSDVAVAVELEVVVGVAVDLRALADGPAAADRPLYAAEVEGQDVAAGDGDAVEGLVAAPRSDLAVRGEGVGGVRGLTFGAAAPGADQDGRDVSLNLGLLWAAFRGGHVGRGRGGHVDL